MLARTTPSACQRILTIVKATHGEMIMNEQDNSNPGKKPDFIAYTVRESRDGKSFWNKVGTAWQHRDGQGYDIQLESLPVDGRVTLRELREDRMQSYEQQQSDSQKQKKSQDRSPRRERTR